MAQSCTVKVVHWPRLTLHESICKTDIINSQTVPLCWKESSHWRIQTCHRCTKFKRKACPKSLNVPCKGLESWLLLCDSSFVSGYGTIKLFGLLQCLTCSFFSRSTNVIFAIYCKNSSRDLKRNKWSHVIWVRRGHHHRKRHGQSIICQNQMFNLKVQCSDQIALPSGCS